MPGRELLQYRYIKKYSFKFIACDLSLHNRKYNYNSPLGRGIFCLIFAPSNNYIDSKASYSIGNVLNYF